MLRGDVLLAILGMAAVTYLCRAGGYAVLRAVRPPPFIEAWLRHLPGPLFVAYVALAFSALGWAGLPAVAAVLLAQRLTGSLSAAILAGVGAIWALQWIGAA
ncbi:AzlD family protein [Teichococcus oryzae]|uniref:AzlD domain-containing protein n=1 Tax=Teichococcus oryzae TaxID=1608942 RepID=A0A5B2TKR3_9PROT|nr:AzlD domain-containing protein [Pseudoroseomonas oryzae]KAA2214508.1 AzlD domain-containing protein [Pseudoroseomonas oryzae]